jgi:hypothetical protein
MSDKDKDNKNLFYLDDMSGYKVASDYSDVRGWKVLDADNRTIGKVDGLLVNKRAERVVYLDIEVDRELIEDGHEPYENSSDKGAHEYLNKDGENHLVIPIGMVHIDDDNKKVLTNEIGYDTFRKTKRHRKGSDISRDHEETVIKGYLPEDTQADDYRDDNFYNRKAFEDRRKRKNDF